MKTLIIIPTYNESENIGKLIAKVNSLNIHRNLNILVIDDNSPDGTADIVRDVQKRYENISLIVREKKMGLGTAYVCGFKWALERDYEAVVEMDADLSHSPEKLQEILENLKKYDFVIGSRYIKGGAIENWSLARRLISKLGTVYAKVILGVNINDFTGGFNAWRTEIFKKVDLDKVKSNGYSFQIELKYKAVLNGFSFVEIPITFSQRTRGKSKISRRIVVEAVYKTFFLRMKNLKAPRYKNS